MQASKLCDVVFNCVLFLAAMMSSSVSKDADKIDIVTEGTTNAGVVTHSGCLTGSLHMRFMKSCDFARDCSKYVTLSTEAVETHACSRT